MNVQKIFEALHQETTDKSALGIICRELENQAYSLAIDDVQVTAEEIFDGLHKDIEQKKSLNIALMNTSLTRKVKIEQEFCVEFTGSREFIIKQKK